MKNKHEFRDPVHGLITCSTEERRVIDSRPVQRLRHIHQLATESFLYPGAAHTRFEHSLGVMELATQIYDVLTETENKDVLTERTLRSIPEITKEGEVDYWRRVLRMAALCHDIGHVPFSHGAESLLPDEMSHEWMTWKLILSEEMISLFKQLHVEPMAVARVAVGPKEAVKIKPEGEHFSPWETIVSEIVVGNVFGADRMDYLLRDSLHSGVTYGLFDVCRLIHSLRILPKAPEGVGGESGEPCIGVDVGGLHTAEALITARYQMFNQVYLHHIRRIYDIHLVEFIRSVYPEGYPTEVDSFLAITDSEIISALRRAAKSPSHGGHGAARRILNREHFKMIYQLTETEVSVDEDCLYLLYACLQQEFGVANVKMDAYEKDAYVEEEFPVWVNETSTSSGSESRFLQNFPKFYARYIFVEPSRYEKAKDWIKKNKLALLNGEGEQ